MFPIFMEKVWSNICQLLDNPHKGFLVFKQIISAKMRLGIIQKFCNSLREEGMFTKISLKFKRVEGFYSKITKDHKGGGAMRD